MQVCIGLRMAGRPADIERPAQETLKNVMRAVAERLIAGLLATAEIGGLGSLSLERKRLDPGVFVRTVAKGLTR